MANAGISPRLSTLAQEMAESQTSDSVLPITGFGGIFIAHVDLVDKEVDKVLFSVTNASGAVFVVFEKEG